MSKIRAANFEDTATGGISVPAKYLTQGSAKAWTRFNQTGTQTINASFNTTSITDEAAGVSLLVWTNAFTSANYGCTGGGRSSTAGFNICEPAHDTYNSASQLRVVGRDAAGAAQDGTSMSTAVNGTLA